MSSSEDLETRRKRLRYRSVHRGMKEMDLILGAFIDRHLESLSAAELDQYETLLRGNDPDLWAWIVGRTSVPSPHDNAVIKLLKSLKDTGIRG